MATIQKNAFGQYIKPEVVDITGSEAVIKTVVEGVAATLLVGTDTKKRELIATARKSPGVVMAYVLEEIPNGVPKPGLVDFTSIMEEVLAVIEDTLAPIVEEGE